VLVGVVVDVDVVVGEEDMRGLRAVYGWLVMWDTLSTAGISLTSLHHATCGDSGSKQVAAHDMW